MLTVGRKITGGFLVVNFMVVVMSIFTYLKIGEINTSYEKVINSNLEKMELAQSFAADLANEAVAMRRFNFTGDYADITIFNEYRKKTEDKIARLDSILKTEKGKNIVKTMQKAKQTYEAIAEMSIEAKKANNLEKVALHMQEAGKPYKEATEATNELVANVKGVVNNEQVEQARAAGQIQMLLLVVNVILIVAAVSLGLVVSRSIARPIRKITESANELAKGDLLQKDIVIKSSDEIGQLAGAFNGMKENLRQLLKQVSMTTEQVAASSEELTASAEQSAQATTQVAQTISEVAEGVENQAAKVNRAAMTVAEISLGIQNIAANAGTVSKMAETAADTAQQGGGAVAAAIEQMTTIETSVAGSAQVVTKLGERSKEIGQIVETISGIAGQTNLLALNAAIEAARAGDHGKGFSVVAEEVRKLAEESRHAAEQIAKLILEIQSETMRAVEAMNNGTREVKSGTGIVATAGQSFKEIAALIVSVTREIREISASIQSIASGSRDMVSSVESIEKTSKEAAGQTQTVAAATEEQSASIHEIATASQALAAMAENLQQAVNRFKV